MELFSTGSYSPVNILPYDGIAEDYGIIMDSPEEVFQSLLSSDHWQNDVVTLFGKTHVTARKVIWMSGNGASYRYSGNTRQSIPWSEEVFALKKLCEKKLRENGVDTEFNSCLLNYYPSGREGMGWHSDNETAIGKESVIASVTLGAERRFLFKHKNTGQKIELSLRPGQLLVMRGVTQQYWLHSLPKMAGITGGRINLTFRKIIH